MAVDPEDQTNASPMPPLKDIAVFLPIVASSIAMSWEVGRFIPFGGFRFFSFSEHVISAIGAFPIALVVTAFLGACAPFFRRLLISTLRLHASFKPHLQPTATIASIVLMFLTLAGTPYFLWRWGSDLPSAIFASLLTAIFFGVNLLLVWKFQKPFASAPALLIIYAGMIAGTMALAAMNSFQSITLAKTDPKSVLSDIAFKGGMAKNVIIVMVGERGILYYDPIEHRSTLAKLDDIQHIEWTQY